MQKKSEKKKNLKISKKLVKKSKYMISMTHLAIGMKKKNF